MEKVKEYLWMAGLLLAAALVGWIVQRLLLWFVGRLSRATQGAMDDSVIRHCRRPVGLLLVIAAVWLALPLLPLVGGNLSDQSEGFIKHLLALGLILAVSWFLIKLTYVLHDYVLVQYQVDVKDNLQARKIHTQLRVLRRIVIVIVLVLMVGTMLMTFDRVRQLGASLLASAGIIGLVLGIAAQKTVATFIAGLQIAITQPIRIDDVVIVEGEWGRIEEITLTYVVVRIWDQRRLIVPITYFIEKPFQNWTRTTADLLGTATFYVDYSVPVAALREQLKAILDESPHWDKKAWGLQVTDTTEHTVVVRALMSAADASSAWDMRCDVREKMIHFIQEHYPHALPRFRAELNEPDQSSTHPHDSEQSSKG